MSEEDLKFFLNKKKELINSENIIKIFQDVFYKTLEIDSKIFYDFLGEVLLERPALFEGKKYFKFLQGYNEFVLNTNIPLKRLLKTEEYFIEKYCILQSEKVLLSFIGVVRYEDIYFRNRVFITNYRIIVVGEPSPHRDGSQGSSCISEVEFLIEDSLKYLTPEILESTIAINLKRVETKDLPLFGFQFPISNPTRIWLIGHKGPVTFTSTPQDRLFITYRDFEIFVNKIYEKKWKEIQQKIIDIITSLQQKN